MNKQNKALLDELITIKLEESLKQGDEAKESFNVAIEAIEKSIELERQKKDRLTKILEVGAIVVAAPLIEAGCKKVFAEMICNFEKDYNFTTTAGRSLASLFRFK